MQLTEMAMINIGRQIRVGERRAMKGSCERRFSNGIRIDAAWRASMKNYVSRVG